MTQISKYCTLEEATRSQTAERHGIDNTPNQAQLENMKFVAEMIFDPIREKFGPITCSSFLRVRELNRMVGSTDRSYHTFGAAIDFRKLGEKYSYKEIFDFVRENLCFSELIWEYGDDNEPAWVHVAYLPGDERKRVKRAYYDKDWKKNRVIEFDLY